jgi:hypothetical protein
VHLAITREKKPLHVLRLLQDQASNWPPDTEWSPLLHRLISAGHSLPVNLLPCGSLVARTLVIAFYRGLGTTPRAATATMQRRDLAIARELIAAGASPGEAPAYARETSGLDGRTTPAGGCARSTRPSRSRSRAVAGQGDRHTTGGDAVWWHQPSKHRDPRTTCAPACRTHGVRQGRVLTQRQALMARPCEQGTGNWQQPRGRC